MKLDRSDTYLFIIAPLKKQSAIVERIGRSGAMEQCVCDNVYQATAEIFKALSDNELGSDKELVIVLAWADNLTLGQMEFFSLLKEREDIVTLAISDNNESKLQTALKAGADRAMFLDNLRPGLFESITNEAKRGQTPLVSGDISICDEEVYGLMEDEETKIIEISAEVSQAREKVGDDQEEDESLDSEVSDKKELTDIALSEDELRSLLDEE